MEITLSSPGLHQFMRVCPIAEMVQDQYYHVFLHIGLFLLLHWINVAHHRHDRSPTHFQEAQILHSLTDHTPPGPLPPLPIRQREEVEGWGKTQRASSYVWRPTTVDEISQVLSIARSHGRTVALHGGGHSYHDATLNAEGITLNLSQMRRILAWDPQRGIISVEPGVTIGDLWRATIADKWWPTVVPSTMEATLGGCLSMNVHGKNAWKMGPIGEHLLAIELLLASGDLITVTPSNDPDLFYAAIGGLGMLGVITNITLQMQPIQSGNLLLCRRPARSLSEMLAVFEEEAPTADFLEGWIDGYADDDSLGRGFVKYACFIDEPDPYSLQPQAQLASSIMGIVPLEFLGRVVRPFFDITSKVSNKIRYRRAASRGSRSIHRIPLAQFLFHSDAQYKGLRALLPTGFHSIQPFVPAEHARAVFSELFERSHHAGIAPAWCVLKRHRSGPFLLSHQLDGFSLELNYPATMHNAKQVATLLTEMLEPIIAAGGRLYLAKDNILDTETYARSMGIDRIERFLAIKQFYDPEGLFQSDLFRRIFPLESRSS